MGTDKSLKIDSSTRMVCNRNLELLRESGAEVVFFSPLTGSLPEGISGIYLGGGYPELHAADLSSRRDLRAAVKAFAEAGGVVYAECGGLLYLSQSIQPLNRMPSSMGRANASKSYLSSNLRCDSNTQVLPTHKL